MRINWKRKPCKSCSSDSLAEAMRRHTSERRRQMLVSSDKCFLLSLPKLSLKNRALKRDKFNILGVVLTPATRAPADAGERPGRRAPADAGERPGRRAPVF
jgi:hypothetical protein